MGQRDKADKAMGLSGSLIMGLGVLWAVSLLSDGAVTINPRRTLTGVVKTEQTVDCISPAVLGSTRVLYDQNASDPFDVTKGAMTPISINIEGREKFVGKAENLGIQNSVLTFRLTFDLTTNYNGSSLRCQFRDTASRNITVSNALLLRVLSPACCNVSGPPIERTTVDQPSVLQLNCSGIIRDRGYPLATITWTLLSISSGCIGIESGNANQFYTINPIVRECNNVTITCVADTGDTRLSLTRQSFDLIIKSPPGRPMCKYDGLRRPLAVFSWREPIYTGGLPFTTYNVFVSSSHITIAVSTLMATTSVEDGAAVEFSVSAQNDLGSGPSCQIRVAVPARGCIMPTQNAASRTSITVTCSATELASRHYSVYYSGNGLSKGQASKSLSTEITGLISNTTYVIVVEAENSQGMLENSSSVMMSTNPTGQPGSVSLAKDNVKDITATSFTLMFRSVQDAGRDNAYILKYKVFINDQRREFASQDEEMQTILIDNLTPNTMYNVTVTVINNLGDEGENSIALSVTTLEAGDGLGVGIIVAIAVACAAIAFIPIVVAIYFWKARRSRSKDCSETSESHSKRGTNIEMTKVTASPTHDRNAGRKKSTVPLYDDVAPISQSTEASLMTDNASYQTAGVH